MLRMPHMYRILCMYLMYTGEGGERVEGQTVKGSKPQGRPKLSYIVLGVRANGSMVLRLSNGCTQDWSWIGL